MSIYIQLFLSFVQIGALSFGGGYAAMPLIQQQVVTLHGWLSPGEFTDLITISQMTPGPIAINSATFVGTRIAGFWGAVAATVGCVLPSCLLVSPAGLGLPALPQPVPDPARPGLPAPGRDRYDRLRRRQHPGHRHLSQTALTSLSQALDSANLRASSSSRRDGAVNPFKKIPSRSCCCRA